MTKLLDAPCGSWFLAYLKANDAIGTRVTIVLIDCPLSLEGRQRCPPIETSILLPSFSPTDAMKKLGKKAWALTNRLYLTIGKFLSTLP